jgi:hypothetical protein
MDISTPVTNYSRHYLHPSHAHSCCLLLFLLLFESFACYHDQREVDRLPFEPDARQPAILTCSSRWLGKELFSIVIFINGQVVGYAHVIGPCSLIVLS